MAALAILRRDLNRYRRNPVRTALLFAMPLVMAAIFALVFSGGVEEVSIRVLLWDEDDSLLSALARGAAGRDQAAQQLDLVPVGEEGLAMMDRGEASALVHIPAGFTRDYLAGRTTTIEVIKNPSERFLPQVVEEGAGIAGAVLSAVSRVFRPELEQIQSLMDLEGFPPDLAVAGLSSNINSRLGGLRQIIFPPVITLETVTVETGDDATLEDVGILAVFLPGFAVMGTLFLAQSATRDILRDREAGLLRQLLTAPVSPGDYLLGKCLSVIIVTVAGFALMAMIGAAMGVSWGPPLATAILILATALAASGTLLLIMSLVGSERQGDTLTTIVIIVWSMLGGAFLPLDQMPGFLRPLSASTLVSGRRTPSTPSSSAAAGSAIFCPTWGSSSRRERSSSAQEPRSSDAASAAGRSDARDRCHRPPRPPPGHDRQGRGHLDVARARRLCHLLRTRLGRRLQTGRCKGPADGDRRGWRPRRPASDHGARERTAPLDLCGPGRDRRDAGTRPHSGAAFGSQRGGFRRSTNHVAVGEGAGCFGGRRAGRSSQNRLGHRHRPRPPGRGEGSARSRCAHR
ncbi:MAG: ABC transporter permease [Candidatus Aminicenantes bacterium]|nr:MAG: ABC transporter permease [Candidatus Aminicenantes bacterium]